jgi:hypothetical protein
MQFWTVSEIEQHAMVESPVEQEISPGVTITRRRILQVGFAGVTGSMLAGYGGYGPSTLVLSEQAESAKTPVVNEALTIEQFLAMVRPRAKELLEAERRGMRPDESSYLTAVAKLLTQYKPEEPWGMPEQDEGEIAMSITAWMPPVLVYDIHMQPGAKIDLHDHRHYNGVLQCIEGEVRCRNFDIVQPDGRPLDIASGEVPSVGESFLIRKNRDQLLKPGQFSTLSRDRDNIHQVVAGAEGCRLSDVFTHFRPEAPSYSLEWDEQPVEKNGDTYEVAWKS